MRNQDWKITVFCGVIAIGTLVADVVLEALDHRRVIFFEEILIVRRCRSIIIGGCWFIFLLDFPDCLSFGEYCDGGGDGGGNDSNGGGDDGGDLR